MLRNILVKLIFLPLLNSVSVKTCSTMDSLVYLTETIRAKVDEDEFVTTALQGSSKAFDPVEHQFLIK